MTDVGAPRRVAVLALVWLALGAAACRPRPSRAPEMRPPEPARLSAAQVARLVGREMGPEERASWADAVIGGLDEIGMLPTPDSVCQVLAVIEQESGYRENPQVPNLAGIVKEGIASYAKRLGPLGPPLVKKLLSAKGAGEKRSFAERFEAARTERDVDRVFRDLVAHYEREHPAGTKAADLVSGLVFDRRLEDYNPITTAGSMQVSVRFARERAGRRGQRDEAAVREELYTRRGGVRHGVARLLGYEASYDEPLHRFADFNAGLYASRNAAVQEQLSRLTGAPLALDGDLLIYDAGGRPSSRESQTLRAFLAFAKRHAPELGERQIEKDLRLEKSLDFESTETYRALKHAYRAVTGKAPAYARMPELTLSSPKLSRKRTTDWFARSVERRCNDCLARARKLAPRAPAS